MKRIRWVLAVAATAMLVLGGVAPGAAFAATARDGNCEVGEFCYYWGDPSFSSASDFNGSVSNYGSSQPGCYEFRTPGRTGYGECVKNNAFYARNRTTANRVTVKFSTGGSQTFAPGQQGWINPGGANIAHQFTHI